MILKNNDAVTVAPHLHTVVEENEKVRILRVNVKPGDSAQMHTHPDSVFVILQGGVLDMTNTDGVTKSVECKTGTSWFAPATEHSVVNNGDTEVKIILIELLN